MKLSLRAIDKLCLCLLWIPTNDSMDCNNKIVLMSVYCYCVSLTLIFTLSGKEWLVNKVVQYQILVYFAWYCVIVLLAGQMWLICIICAVVTCNVDAATLDSSLFCMTLCDNLAGWANVVSLYMCCGHMQCRCSIIIMHDDIIICCYYPLHVHTAWMINFMQERYVSSSVCIMIIILWLQCTCMSSNFCHDH